MDGVSWHGGSAGQLMDEAERPGEVCLLVWQPQRATRVTSTRGAVPGNVRRRETPRAVWQEGRERETAEEREIKRATEGRRERDGCREEGSKVRARGEGEAARREDWSYVICLCVKHGRGWELMDIIAVRGRQRR